MSTAESESNPPHEPEPACTNDMALSLCDEGARLGPAALAWLHDAILQAMVAMRRSGQLSVKIVGDDEMARAHETHKGCPGTTDVLTFDLSAGEAPLDADLLVCADEARRQALARGHAIEQEVLLYVVHGVLHCTGYDDHDAAAAERMHRAEDEILAAVGVGATYARPAGEERT